MATAHSTRMAILAASVAVYGATAPAAEFTFLTHPSLAGLVTSDPYLGNGDDQVVAGINTFGGASQYLGSTGIYGFLGGTMATQGLTAFGPHPQQVFGANEHTVVDMFGEWNFNAAGLFNQPHAQSLDPGSPSVITISPDQTYTTSFVFYDDGYDGRIQFTGSGQYLLNYQYAPNWYSGDVLTHFNTVTPLLPMDWQGVAQESQNWSVLDGPNAGITGFTTSTFFTTDTQATPIVPPVPIGAPWVTTGFVATFGAGIQIGGDISRFPGLGGPGTATLADGNVVSGEAYTIGTPGVDAGNLFLSGAGTASIDSRAVFVFNGALNVAGGALLEVDVTGMSRAALLGSALPESSLILDGPGSEIRVRGGTADFFGIPVEGMSLLNYAAVLDGATGYVRGGAQLIVEGENGSAIGIGGLDSVDPGETDELSVLIVDGSGSLIDGGKLVLVGTHPDILSAAGELLADPGQLEVRDGAVAKAQRIVIGPDGTVTGNGGTLEGTVDNHGTVMPGDSPGRLDVFGDYIQREDGMLIIEIGGTEPGAFDQLIISATATLGGTLKLELIGGFTPHAGDVFDFFIADSLQGDFDNVILPVFGNQTFVVNPGPNGFSATVAPVPLPPAVVLFACGIIGLALERRTFPGRRRKRSRSRRGTGFPRPACP